MPGRREPRSSTGSGNFALSSRREYSPMGQYDCIACRFRYYERSGRPDEGIRPGTPWPQVPASWRCPDCGKPKSAFVNSAS